MTKKVKAEETKIPELERKIGETPIAHKLGYHIHEFSHLNDYICVCDFLPKDAIRRIAVTAREHLRERLVPDDD